MANKPSSSKQPNQEHIVNGFNELRNQQRQFVAKLSDVNAEKKEYQLVLDTLKNMENERTCYRMVGGVLVQKTVGEVTPMLEDSIEQMGTLTRTLEEQVELKGKQLVEYREKHNIRLQNEAPPVEKPAENQSENKSAGVLVTS